MFIDIWTFFANSFKSEQAVKFQQCVVLRVAAPTEKEANTPPKSADEKILYLKYHRFFATVLWRKMNPIVEANSAQ